jgi:hypothetical protein
MSNYSCPFRAAKWRPEATYFNRQCRQQGRSIGSPGQGVNSRRAAISQSVGPQSPEGHVIVLDIFLEEMEYIRSMKVS